jgi:hypothetical protein
MRLTVGALVPAPGTSVRVTDEEKHFKHAQCPGGVAFVSNSTLSFNSAV